MSDAAYVVEQFLCRRNEVGDRVSEGVDYISVGVFELHELRLELLGRLAVLDGRHSYGLRDLELDVVLVVEFFCKLNVPDAHRMVLDGPEGKPAALPDTRPGTEKHIHSKAGGNHGAGYFRY